jgi:alginate O-acetyltransferase complex protein AlgI
VTFSSLTFLIFFAVVFTAYWALGRRRPQNVLLLIASYVFYGWWDWRFAGLMLASSLADYSFGLAIHWSQKPLYRKLLLVATLVANLSLLGFFKYFNFFAESFAVAAGSMGWQVGDLTLNIILPVGISFYTFQSLSYTIDIYRKQLAPTKNVVDYLAFVSFFPQLVAGPIERAADLLPQFGVDRKFNATIAADGLRQMLWGLFKKLAVADRLATIVEPAFANPGNYSGPFLLLATICFAFQIYCDFSGYSDMAVGVGKQFGIRLSRNFAYPYFSRSLREFWRRWHISLSTWFRDYVYYPLGGNRTQNWKHRRNLIVTFLVSGIWHGAAWTFVAWGALHGLMVAVLPAASAQENEPPGGSRLIPRPIDVLRMAWTFALVCALWVFFRAASFADAQLIWQTMAVDLFNPAKYGPSIESLRGIESVKLTFLALALLLTIEWLGRRHEHPLMIGNWPRGLRWTAYTAMLWGTVLFIPTAAGKNFIYFDF